MIRAWELFASGVDKLERAGRAADEVKDMAGHAAGLGLLCMDIVDEGQSVAAESRELAARAAQGEPPSKLELALRIGSRFL